MPDTTMLKMLQEMAFARELKPRHLDKLVSIASEVTFSEDEIVFREDEPAEFVYLIQEGAVAVELDVPTCGPVTTYRVGAGELLGWSSMFPGQRRTSGAHATTPSRAIAINAEQLCEACRADHDLGCAIMSHAAQVLSDRLRSTRRELLQMFSYVFA